MVYGRLDACPMGLLSSRPYTLLRFSLSNPLSDCFHPRQAYSGNPTNYVHDWWREKSEKVKDREGQKKEEERPKTKEVQTSRIIDWAVSVYELGVSMETIAIRTIHRKTHI